MKYVAYMKPKQCTSFLSWLLYSWDFPSHRPLRNRFAQVRIAGFRIFGFEFENHYTVTGEWYENR